jgi:hypothetical protein
LLRWWWWLLTMRSLWRSLEPRLRTAVWINSDTIVDLKH